MPPGTSSQCCVASFQRGALPKAKNTTSLPGYNSATRLRSLSFELYSGKGLMSQAGGTILRAAEVGVGCQNAIAAQEITRHRDHVTGRVEQELDLREPEDICR